MTTADRRGRGLLRRFRLVYLAPVLAMLALSSWAFASPIGAGPDDDFHLISTWCAGGGSELCEAGASDNKREVPRMFKGVTCYVQVPERSASCQESSAWAVTGVYQTKRGNFTGEYPPVFYAVNRVFATGDLQTSALVMRVVNALIFVALATALAALLPASRRGTLLWGWLVALVPLGIFLIPSNNPSGWAITGVGTAFLALLGWFEAAGRRRWALGALYLVGVVMAAGARGDAAVYAAGATVTAAILTSARTRDWAYRAILPAAGLIVAIVFFALAGQAGVGAQGFSSGVDANPEAGGTPLTGAALAAYNLLMLPFLLTGVWGTWGLGWFDTGMPAAVPAGAIGAFVVVAFAGLGLLTRRKAIAVAGVALVLIVLPVYVLTVGGDKVGDALQPRYLLPLIVLLTLVILTVPAGRELRFTRVQTTLILVALSVANLVALQVNIRRYVTGSDQQGIDLDAGAEWWWNGLPLGPTAVWVIGTLAFGGLLAVLGPRLQSTVGEPDPERARSR